MPSQQTTISTRLLKLAQEKQLIYNALRAQGSMVNFNPYTAYAAAISALEDYVPEVIASMPFTNGTEPSTGNVWYVSPGGRGLKNGINWDNAFATRQEAANAASAGDHIRVWEGLYELAAVQTPKALVSEYYGFNGNGTWAERQPFTHPSKHDALFGTNNFLNADVAMTTEIIDGLRIQHVSGAYAIRGDKGFKGRNLIVYECAGGIGIYGAIGSAFNNCISALCNNATPTAGLYISNGTATGCIAFKCNGFGLQGYSNGILNYCQAIACTLTAADSVGGIYLYNGSRADSCVCINCRGATIGGVHAYNSNVINTTCISCKGATYGGIWMRHNNQLRNCTVINCDGTYSIGLQGLLNPYNCVAWGGPIGMLNTGLAYNIRNCASNVPLYFAAGADTNATVTDFHSLVSSPFLTLGNAPFTTPGAYYYSMPLSDEVIEFFSNNIMPNIANPRPHPTSPLIGAGYYEAGVTPDLDADGNTRPHPPSIGAYEYAETL